MRSKPMRSKPPSARSWFAPLVAAACLLALAGCGAADTRSANNSNGRAASQINAPTAATPATPVASPSVAPSTGQQAGVAAASQSAPPAASKSSDPCALLTSDDIKSVQGESAAQIKPGRQEGAEFSVSQCFYQTPTFTKSVSLELTERGASRKSVREFWRERVATYEERRGAKNERREKSGKPLAGPAATPVRGVGDEAYWVGTSANGTLYAFKKDALLRVSIGGPDKDAERLRKVKTLAQKALARL